MAEMQGDEGAADCLIWRKASKQYKSEAKHLDDEMCELILFARVAKRMLKAVIRVCKRGTRQTMYATSSELKTLLQSAQVDPLKHHEASEKMKQQPASHAKSSARQLIRRTSSWEVVRNKFQSVMGFNHASAQ